MTGQNSADEPWIRKIMLKLAERRRGNVTWRTHSAYRTVFDFSIILIYLSIIYQQIAILTLLMAIICFMAIFSRFDFQYLFRPLAFCSVFYVFLALCTSFLIDWPTFLYRSAQFLIVTFSCMSISVYVCSLGQRESLNLFRKLLIVTLLILLHMVSYHIINGYYTTWKYLYDTKTVLSVSCIIIFLLEDKITNRSGVLGWLFVLFSCFLLILISGERKAYLLLFVLFAISRLSIGIKALILAVAVLGVAAYASVADENNYVVRQVSSVFKSQAEIPLGDFFNRSFIEGQSDIVREFVNRNAWQLFLENPILGIGGTGYASWAIEKYGFLDENGGLSMNVHGEINRVPVEEGVIGIFVGLFLLSLMMKTCYVHIRLYRWRYQTSMFRFPIYALIFLLIYSAFEAADTGMYILIMLVCFQLTHMHDLDIQTIHSLQLRRRSTRW